MYFKKKYICIYLKEEPKDVLCIMYQCIAKSSFQVITVASPLFIMRLTCLRGAPTPNLSLTDRTPETVVPRLGISRRF